MVLLTFNHVSDCLAGEVQQALDVQVVGRLQERTETHTGLHTSVATGGITQTCIALAADRAFNAAGHGSI